MYYEGKGVDVDFAKSRQLYEKVANYCPNDAIVQRILGNTSLSFVIYSIFTIIVM